MATNGNSLVTSRQRRALVALLSAPNVPEAARRSGVGARTLYRWLKEPAFQAALLAAETEALNSATRRLTTLADAAVDALHDVLVDPAGAASLRLRAAEIVLGQLLRLREARDVEQRLVVLEAVWQTRDTCSNG